MTFINGTVFTQDGTFQRCDFNTEDGLFSQIKTNCPKDINVVDLEGSLVIPGLVDIHTHGNNGFRFETATKSEFDVMTKYLATNGITTISASTTAIDAEVLLDSLRNISNYMEHIPSGHTQIRSISMEGPFMSPNKNGAMEKKNFILPQISLFHRFQEAAKGYIKMICVAPEVTGAIPFIEEISKNVNVSMGHTCANYQEACNAFEAGVTQINHLYNAMDSGNHRESSVLYAGAETDYVVAQLIADGIHIHPSVIKATFKLFCRDRVALISDSVQFCGLPDGIYPEKNRIVTVKDKRAMNENGTICGSTMNLFEGMKNLISYGIAIETAIKSVTETPAKALGLCDVGVIAVGKNADFVVCDTYFNINSVYINGNKI